MYLKSLVLKGFKSFADRSALTLEPGITAVVGPNGSGKSNISDAVLWVLGERNAKNLRGQVMEDVIFAGSSARKSVSMAEVSLVLDNSDGSLPVDFDEVSISRRMYRNGESEYLINGAVVRRMDVLDILHDSGLGTGTHSIISQGHLDSILQSKPEDRRALIEEAAGVLKHKQRKAKSLRKIEQMDQHLARVNDVVSELDRQLGPLQRKARRAMQYQEVSEQLQKVQLALAVDDLRTLQGKWDALLATEAGQEADVEAKRGAAADAERAYLQVQERIRRESEGVNALTLKQGRANSLVDRLDSQILLLGEKQRQATARCEELSRMLEENASKRTAAQSDREGLASELSRVQAERAEAQRALEAAQADYDQAHNRRLDLEREVNDLRRRRNDVERECERTRRELSAANERLSTNAGRVRVAQERKAEIANRLEQAQEADAQAAAQYDEAQSALGALQEKEEQLSAKLRESRTAAEAARRAVQAAQSQVSALAAEEKGIQEVERAVMAAAGPAHAWVAEQKRDDWGTLSPLYDHVQVEPGYEAIVERLLGDDVTALLVSDSARVRSIGAALEGAGKSGQVTLVLSRGAANAPRAAVGERLLDKVTCDDAIASNMELLLGDVVVCPTLDAALSAHEADTVGLRYVTARGEVVCPSGKVLLGARAAEASGGSLARSKRLAEVRRELQTAQKDLQKTQQAAQQAEDAVTAAQDASLAARQEFAAAKGRAQSAQRARDDAKRTLASVQAENERCAKAADEAQAAVDAAQPVVDELSAQVSDLEQRLEDAKDEVRRKSHEIDPARDAETARNQQLSDAKLASATLMERETYASRSVDARARELVALSQSDETALRQLTIKQSARSRMEPLRETLVTLREGAYACARVLGDQVATAAEATTSSHASAQTALQVQRDAKDAFDRAGEALNQTRIEKARLELQVQAAADAIVHDCHTPMEQALALPPLEDRGQTQDRAFKLQKRIANMGVINPDAAAEYEELKERYDYLKGQLADLASARIALKKIDRVIDQRMKDDFVNTFHVVDQYFQEIFAVLFPGGTASLSLVDPENLETTGVEVTAQPRGKRITKMTLMSGGEKSLVACALLFAVYRTRSTPFYILDEIEAALDDSNLRRLTSYLRDLSADTQLIMITHQRRTMEMADVLFGVSMQADGVTKVISQRLDKALQYAE